MTAIAQDHAPRLVQATRTDPELARNIVANMGRMHLEELALFLAHSIRFARPDDLAARDSIDVEKRLALIVRFVADSSGVDAGAIYGKGLSRRVTDARAVVEAVAYRTGLSVVPIAEALGRHHSSVSHSSDKVWRDPELTQLAEETLLRLAGVGALV